MQRILMLAALAAATILAADSEALARHPGRGFGNGLFFGGGVGRTTTIWDLYQSGQIPIPPYFALNPPVYYSYPVPRTYGYSPWPYPGDTRTPDVMGTIQPMEIVNPYFESSDKQPAPAPEETVNATPKASAPLVINNPYVNGSSSIYQVAH